MSRRRASARSGGRPRVRALIRIVPALLLAAENVVVFWNHYFRGYGFPWDFLGGYYSVVAWWTSAVRYGVFPQWVPFQFMGYPLPINLQSGMFYPFLWVFPFLHRGYSIHRAVVLQCLHVGAGALGAYALLRRVGRSRRDALLGAFAFQLFGAFYSNAEHPDIVRGAALAPWLLWALTLRPDRSGSRTSHSVLFLPIVIFLLAAGAYPGIFLAGAFLGVIWVGAQIAMRWNRAGRPRLLREAAAVIMFALIGIAMASLPLGPAWLHRAELSRYLDYATFEPIGLDFRHLPGLFLPNRWLAGNASMNCAYLPLPILLAVLWSPIRRRRAWPALALLIAAALMIAGPGSPLYRIMRAIVPPLGFSRLPSADYRPFLALAIVMLGASGLARLRRSALSWRHVAFAALLAAGVITIVPRGIDAAAIVALIAAWGASCALTGSGARRRMPAFLIAGSVMLLMLVDSARVLWRMQHLDLDLWRVPDAEGIWRRRFPRAFSSERDGIVSADLFALRPGARPGRRDRLPGEYRAAGYLTGELLTGDFGGNALEARLRIEADPRLAAYMRSPWIGLLVPPGPAPSIDRLFANEPGNGGEVRQTAWGNDRNEYEVSLEKPVLLVENEIYFPGWTAVLPDSAPIPAVRVAGALRGWPLRAGRYRMTTRFRMPGLSSFLAVSVAALVLYLGLLVAWKRLAIRRTPGLVEARSDSQ